METQRLDSDAMIALRSRSVWIALLTSIVLTSFKIVVGVFSGSVAVLSDGIHSLTDIVSAGVAFVTVKEAVKPADSEHPYGHGKFETLSALFESVLLIVVGGWIVYEGVQHVISPHPLKHEWTAIVVTAIAAIASYGVYRHNSSAAEKTESNALKINAEHYFSDVLTALGLLAGLIFIKITGWVVFDAIMAFAVAGYILMVTTRQIRESLSELVDQRLPESEVKEIEKLINQFQHKFVGYHRLRTRRSGIHRHIDFHLDMCAYFSVQDSHAVCDEIEMAIKSRFPKAVINIHVEPCHLHVKNCHETCELANQRRSS